MVLRLDFYLVPELNNMYIIERTNLFIGIGIAIAVLSLAAIFIFKLPLGVDFTGGSILEISYTETPPSAEEVSLAVSAAGFSDALIQRTGESGYIIRTKELDDTAHQALLSGLSFRGERTTIEERSNSIGPTIGAELRQKAWLAIGTVVLAIILFIAFAFRNVTNVMRAAGREGVSSWTFGFVAIAALAHDILVPTGIFAILGAEIDTLFVMALLAILGFSVNDTIVVFDRIRENIIHDGEEHTKKEFQTIVGESISQTIARSINTSLTTLVVLGALFFIGGTATQYFALTLAIGVVAGTYSSICLASPLLVWIEKRRNG